jgi:1-acyl-sn-glycerol-3-phosphate acyltransferase
MKLSRCPITVEGREHFDGTRPAICVGNHTSIVDAFTSIWLVPPGTVGVAKKQILYYPFYGQIWYLSGHLTLDRANTEKAKASMCKLADYVRRKKLQVLMWPEGTRARDGRLLPFKKGFVHLALATGLPIVPMVTTGAHRVWDKGSLKLREVPISIRFLPAIDTSSWSLETISDHVQQVWKTMHDALPSDQRPSPRKS